MFTKRQIKALESLKGWKEFFEQPNRFDIADQKRQQLLDMAKNGEPRPRQKDPLGMEFRSYIRKKSDCYNFSFDYEIRKLRPDWFDTVDQKRQQLLDMAKSGEPRPKEGKHPLGKCFANYTRIKSKCYHLEFDKQIRKLRPDWFVRRSEIADNKKKQLLEMAKNGEPRPVIHKHLLGNSLEDYTRSNSGSYDPIFDKQIRELRPDWFITLFNKADQKRQQLLKMAENGEPKPVYRKHPLGIVFCHYINKESECYDPIFDKQIRKLRPDWFISQSDKANDKKQQLLHMAKTESRPISITEIGSALCCYTNKNREQYDSVFDQTIRKLRPDWFAGKGHKCSLKHK